jgi:surface polysaccharide O-acyltransferase-like enzyme
MHQFFENVPFFSSFVGENLFMQILNTITLNGRKIGIFWYFLVIFWVADKIFLMYRFSQKIFFFSIYEVL